MDTILKSSNINEMNVMERPVVSIIIPTYNVEKYLVQCLDSVNEQIYNNYEVIIVIDGATDASYELAKKYSETHDKFFVYWQENAGSGPARNTGLRYAKGEFVMFVDPDDWLESDCLAKLMEAQHEKDYDLTISNKINCFFDKRDCLVSIKKVNTENFEVIGRDNCRKMYLNLFCKGYVGAPTRKIYKMSLIKDCNVEFPAYRRSQDIVFNYRYFDCISSIRSIDYCGYYYRNSMTNNVGKVRKDYIDIIVAIYSDIKTLHKKWDIDLNSSKLASAVFVGYLNIYMQVAAYYKYDVKQLFQNTVVKEIIKESQPDGLFLKVSRLLLMTGYNGLALKLFRIVYSSKLRVANLRYCMAIREWLKVS